MVGVFLVVAGWWYVMGRRDAVVGDGAKLAGMPGPGSGGGGARKEAVGAAGESLGGSEVAAPVAGFREWLVKWRAAGVGEREGLVAEGVAWAEARRPVMQRLIRRDPALALEVAVRPVERQDLPADVLAHLEVPVSARGDYKAYFGRPEAGAVLAPDTELALRYFETPEGASYKAHVFGSLLEMTTRRDVALRGYAIGRDLAVAPGPVRQLEAGERIPAGTPVTETCPVSNQSTPTETAEELTVDDDTPVVELAGRLIRLCNGSHVRIFEEAQRQALGGPGVSGFFHDAYPGTSSEAIGNFRCLYIRVTYPDQMRAPNSEARAWEDMRNVSRYYLESSFGKLTTTTTVTPLIVMPHTKAWYIAKDEEVDGLGLVHSDARAQARLLGYDSREFNCTIVRVNEGPRLSGISWGGGDSVWVSWNGMDVLNHECGHSLGRNHANFWKTSDGSAIGLGSNQEYGNSFDVMGGGSGFGAHYNSYSKRSLGWLPDPYIHRPAATPAANGVYRLHAYDQPQLEDGKKYGFRLDKDPQRKFYLEYHPAVGGEWTDSLLMMLGGLGSNAGHLIDTTPGSPDGKSDGGIRVGRTFSDFESDVHFTVLGKNATTPPSLDVAVMRGPFPGNRAPVITGFTASAASVAVNGSATFSVTAADPDGDALAYHWDFTDRAVTTSTPSVTRSFPTTDQQTVHVTVSDMKGGTARRSTVITIGSPNRAVVRGTVTAGGQPLAGVLITSDTDKYCYTDTDGSYALADLTAGARTLTAMLAGYTFTAGFTNPVTTTANGTVTNAHWTGVSVPEVTLTAVNGAEGGANGAFVLTRTGNTGAPLEVKVTPVTGSATKSVDFTLSPDYLASGSLQAVTIPAGQASLTMTVVVANDSAAEGPETIQMQLAAGDYQVRSSGVATVTLADNDTALPVVSISATDASGSETAGDAIAYTISRTGSTAAALEVTLAFGGTATRGSDYPALPTALSLPAGQGSALLTLVPTDDAAIEIPEDATVTVASHAAYIVNPTAATAAATLTDNDLAVVTATALDATLHEAGRDTGTVVVSRTGSLSAPLTVYYGLHGRALHGSDYVALPGQVTFPVGAASVPVVITPYDDSHGEGDESIVLNLTVFDNAYTLGPAFSATLTLKDNADPPLVTVTADSAAEPSTNGTFTFTALGSVPGPITVYYTLGGTATAGSDFAGLSGSVTIAGSGEHTNTATVTLPVLNDTAPENTETVVLSVTPNPAYSIYNEGRAVMRLRDDDAEPIAVSTHSESVGEPNDAGSFYLSRLGSAGALAVNYTLGGTAINGTDYQLLSGSTVIPDGATGVEVAVTPIDDSLREGVETITLTLAPGAGYGIEVASGTLQFQDNDLTTSLPSMGFAAASSTTGEAPDPVSGQYRDIAVTLPAAGSTTVSLEYVVAGGSAVADGLDWQLVDPAAGNAPVSRGVLTFAPGETSKNVRVRVVDDGVLEGPETAMIDLVHLNVGGGSVRLSSSRSRHTLTINDHAAAQPVPRVSFLTSATTRTEGDGTEPMLIAALDSPSAGPVAVAYTVSGTATEGVDFTLPAGTLTFAAGEMFKKLPLVIQPDSTPEGPETIVVTLASPVGLMLGALSTHTITLAETNRPVLGVAASAPSCLEDTGSATFVISRLGGPAGLAVNVTYVVGGTALSGNDFQALSGSVVLAADQDSVTLPVVPIADLQPESDEAVQITLVADPAYDLGPGAEATVLLLDDDAPPVLTLVSPASRTAAIPSGVGLMLEVEATRDTPAGRLYPPITWSQVGDAGTAVFEDTSARRTGVTFSAPGTYMLRAAAVHGTEVTLDLPVTVGAAPVPELAVGATNAPASVAFDAASGTYTVAGAGSGLAPSGTADGFHFVAMPRTGDFDLKCRIVSVANPGGNSGACRFGLMVRADGTAGAPYFMSLHKADGRHSRHSRSVQNAAGESSDGSTSYVFPRWVRVVRAGDTFSSWYGTNGTSWTQRGTARVIPGMGTTPLVGLAVTSGVPATASTVVFDSLSFTITGNLGPFVDAGVAMSGAGPFVLDGSVTDDGLPLPAALASHWSQRSGPATAAFGYASLMDTGLSLPAPGAYGLRLTATDGVVATFDDTLVQWIAPRPIEAWRQTEFGDDANTPGIADDDADVEADGIANFVEYALALDPHASSQHLLPSAVMEESVIQFTWRRNVLATDVTYEVQTSSDNLGWTTVTPLNEIIGTDGDAEIVRSTLPRTGHRQFVRLRVLPPG
jgi:hypothetical protein